MTFAVGDACVDILDRSCIGVCPVDCIFVGGRKTYIHAGRCIDCGACAPACPIDAISAEGQPGHDRVVAENMAYFREILPGRDAPLGSPAAAWDIGPLSADPERVRALPPSGGPAGERG